MLVDGVGKCRRTWVRIGEFRAQRRAKMAALEAYRGALFGSFSLSTCECAVISPQPVPQHTQSPMSVAMSALHRTAPPTVVDAGAVACCLTPRVPARHRRLGKDTPPVCPTNITRGASRQCGAVRWRQDVPGRHREESTHKESREEPTSESSPMREQAAGKLESWARRWTTVRVSASMLLGSSASARFAVSIA